MKNNILKFAYLVISAAIFSVFIILDISYSLNIIYLIGDSRQLYPLFLGLVLGSFVYSIAGSFFKKRSLIIGLIISAISLAIATYAIYSLSMVLNNEEMLILSFLVTSPIMPATQFFSSIFSNKKFYRIIFSILSSIVFLSIIFVFAILYEKSGQTILPLGISGFAYLSIFISIVMLITKVKNGVNFNG